MIKWIDVLRRLLALYNVHTQAELSMAMAMPVEVGIEDAIQDSGISWEVLEKAVLEQCVDWNWLLTGAGTGPELYSGKQKPDRLKPEAAPEQPYHFLPSLDTRELERVLLDNDDSAVKDQLNEEIAQMNREDAEKGGKRKQDEYRA